MAKFPPFGLVVYNQLLGKSLYTCLQKVLTVNFSELYFPIF